VNLTISNNSSRRFTLQRSLFVVALLTIEFLLGACATKPPLRPDIQTLMLDPDGYDNQRVELTGQVIDYGPARGDTYRTLRFTLGSGPEEKISVFCSGYEADAIAKASDMVGEAFAAGGTLVVVGKLNAGDGDQASVELDLETAEFGGRRIDVSRGTRTHSGFDVGGFHITPSIGIGATFSP